MWLYNIAILLYANIIKLVARWNPKAKLWCLGRKDIFSRMESSIAPGDRILWMHVASLGEFEQGRPLLEKIKEEHPEFKILLTFFSPSGYELRKNYQGADYIFYLPVDTPSNARKFLKVAHPEIAIFVKYEFWLNMLYTLRSSGVKTYIISSIFRRNSIFFRSYGVLWRKALESFKIIFVQNQESKSLLSEIGIEDVVVAGDTRFDRVAAIAKAVKPNPIIEKFKNSTPLFIAGSTWPADEEILAVLTKKNPQVKFVIVPHEIHNERIEAMLSTFEGAIRYSQVNEQSAELSEKQILILDTMGQLSSSYAYAKWAYIGGGFGVGIHNTLEASTFGLPLAFGPNYHKFKEAVDMIELGGSHSVKSAEELVEWFSRLSGDQELYAKLSKITKDYTSEHQGASKMILENIFG